MLNLNNDFYADLTTSDGKILKSRVDTFLQSIKEGSDPNTRDMYGNTVLLLVSCLGPKEIIESLLNAGLDVNAKNNYEETPLHRAAEYGNIEVLDLLMKAGADINAQTKYGGYTPLHLAVKEGQKEVIEALIEAGADTEIMDSHGRTPLGLALTHKNAQVRRKRKNEIVKVLRAAREKLNP